MNWEIKEVKIEEKTYPLLLKKIKNPPKILYVLGNLIENEKCVAIVGTRKCTDYGKEVALEIGGNLAEAGLTIVSGFAPGIDTFAHLAAIERKKRTIAVLGTGLDKKSLYPKSNLKLVEKILENGGCLISEYPPGTKGTKFTFPQRNRIIAGLSLGVIVIEAKLKSGALITAEFAKKERRKIFAIPGSIYSPTSKGCHLLIKQGAKLIETPEEVLIDLGLDKKVRKKIVEGDSEEENLILKILKEGALSSDLIIEKTKLSPQKVLALLSILEIKGKIKNLGGNIFTIWR